MASDNPSFVDTENTRAAAEAPRAGAEVEGGAADPAAARIAEPSGGDERNDTADRSPREERLQASSGDCERRTEAPETQSAAQDEQTHTNANTPEDEMMGARGAVTKAEPENGSLPNGRAKNGSAVRAEPEGVRARCAVAATAESGKAANGLNGAALNGATAFHCTEGDHGAMALAKGQAASGGESGRAPAYPPGEAGRMLRNAVGVGVVFMVHFTATLGVTHLQSSVNKAQGLGTSALAAQYAGLVLSSLALSVLVISKLGCKWTMVVAIACNVPYMCAQLMPRVYTLVPAAFLMGLAVAPLWSAKCTYLCVVSEARAQLTGRPLAAVRDRVIGVFFMVFLLSMVWGNLVSSLVLSHGGGGGGGAGNATVLCGVDFCPNSAAANDNPNLERPPQEKISLIIGIYIAFMLLAALVAAVYVDSLKRYSEGQRASSATGLRVRGLLTATLSLHQRKEMLLLVPLSLWLGVDYAFVEAEYTASFVACAWGIQNIGYVIIVYGLFNSGMALTTGWIVSRAGRRPVVCAAAVIHAGLIGSVLAWRPSSEHKLLFFVVAGIWGALDGHWAVQLNSLYAILFPHMEEAAYSNFRLWQSIGFVVAFSYSHYICTMYKLYIVLALLAVGVAGYLGIECSRTPKARLADG